MTVYSIQPLYLFLFLVGARHIIQTIMTRRLKKEGMKKDLSGTIALAVCYIIVLLFAGYSLYTEREYSLRFCLGIIMMEVFVFIRIIALKNLGEFFSYEIRISKDHELIQKGVYSLVRHPLHLAFWGEVAGMAVIGNSSPGYLVTLVLFFIILKRNQVEDQILEDQFGEKFRIYKKKVPSMNIVTGILRCFNPTGTKDGV